MTERQTAESSSEGPLLASCALDARSCEVSELQASKNPRPSSHTPGICTAHRPEVPVPNVQGSPARSHRGSGDPFWVAVRSSSSRITRTGLCPAVPGQLLLRHSNQRFHQQRQADVSSSLPRGQMFDRQTCPLCTHAFARDRCSLMADPTRMDSLSSDPGAENGTSATIRRDFALLCRKTTADCLRNDCIAVRKLTALCQQIVSTFSWQHFIFLSAG